MKLVVVDDNGMAVDAVKNIEEYDLSRPLARASIMDGIKEAVDYLTDTPEKREAAARAAFGRN